MILLLGTIFLPKHKWQRAMYERCGISEEGPPNKEEWKPWSKGFTLFTYFTVLRRKYSQLELAVSQIDHVRAQHDHSM